MVDPISIALAIIGILIGIIALILVFVRSGGSGERGPTGPSGAPGPQGPPGTGGNAQTYSDVIEITNNSYDIPALDGTLYFTNAPPTSVFTLGTTGQILTPGTSITLANLTGNTYQILTPFCDYTRSEQNFEYTINPFSINTLVATEPGQCPGLPSNYSSLALIGTNYAFD